MRKAERNILVVSYMIALVGGFLMTFHPSSGFWGVFLASLGIFAFIGESVDALVRRLNDVLASLERSRP